MDPQTRLELGRWIAEHDHLIRRDSIRPPHSERGQIVGVPPMTFKLTHLPTGVTVTVPPEYSRSQIKCMELAENLLAAAVIALGLEPDTLR